MLFVVATFCRTMKSQHILQGTMVRQFVAGAVFTSLNGEHEFAIKAFGIFASRSPSEPSNEA